MRLNKLLVPLAFSMLFSGGVSAATDLTEANFKEYLAKHTPLAEQGDAESQMVLGIMYSEGMGVLENDRTGAKWFTLAAKQGNADAQWMLAVKFNKGEGVLENNSMARQYAEDAAVQGHGDAQHFLAILTGLDEEYIRSYMWFILAVYNNAMGDVTEDKESLEKVMERTDIAKAQEMASRCLESGYKDCGILPVLEYDDVGEMAD